MKTEKQKNSLRDLIINNPRANDRIDMKKIEKQVRQNDKNFISNAKHQLWVI